MTGQVSSDLYALNNAHRLIVIIPELLPNVPQFYIHQYCYMNEELNLRRDGPSSISQTSSSSSTTTSAIALTLASSPSFTLHCEIFMLEMSSGK